MIRGCASDKEQCDHSLLRSLIASIPDIIFYKDCEGRYLGANPAFEAYAGIVEKNIIGRTDLDFLPHDAAEFYRRRDREVLDSNTPRRNEEWIVYPDGRRALLETLKTPIRGPEGVVLGIIGISRDITAARETEGRLYYRMRFQALLARLSKELINPQSNIDNGITKALKGTGEFVGADRTYVFQIKPGNEIMDNTHEWCAVGIEPKMEVLQKLATNVFPWWMTLLANGETIRVPKVADLPEIARAEREILQAQGIQSVLVIPLADQGGLRGFVGFDAVRAEIQWDADSVELLRFVADIIVNAIEQKSTRQKLLEAKEEAERAKRAQMMFLANMSGETPDVQGLARWLPKNVCAGMSNAIKQGDVLELRRHIDGCAPVFPQLARQLRYLADRFAYDRLLEVLSTREEAAHVAT
jgi:two-component system sensor histidine kinase/response regulator